jgi:hypothetical protein
MAVFHNQGKSIASKEAAGAYNGPVSVGRFVAPIAGKTLSRGGAVLTELVCEWPAIAGPALARYTRPEKRINQTLGFRAVSGLRVVQAPVLKKAANPPAVVKPAPSKKEEPAPENRLSAALARMALGVKARGCSG